MNVRERLTTDFALGLVAMLFLLMIIIMMLISEKGKQADLDIETPGSLIVSMKVPPGDIDVDLWVKGPREDLAIGFNNPKGLDWNLLVDDMGNYPDGDETSNFETSFARNIPPGEYIINVHCYFCNRDVHYLPVTVKITVSMLNKSTGKVDRLIEYDIVLTTQWQEKTAFRFTIDDNGGLVNGSVNNIFKHIAVIPSTQVFMSPGRP